VPAVYQTVLGLISEMAGDARTRLRPHAALLGAAPELVEERNRNIHKQEDLARRVREICQPPSPGGLRGKASWRQMMTTDDLLNEKREEIREKLGADSKQHPLKGPPHEATRFPASLFPYDPAAPWPKAATPATCLTPARRVEPPVSTDDGRVEWPRIDEPHKEWCGAHQGAIGAPMSTLN